MSAPASIFWSNLIDLDRTVDGLIAKALNALQPSKPISREIPVWWEAEALFPLVPTNLAGTPSPLSSLFSGNNQKRVTVENNGSRVYLRELSFIPFVLSDPPGLAEGATPDYIPYERKEAFANSLPVNFHWNISTSITQRKYGNVPMMAKSSGNPWAGTHLSFRDPFVVEPREALVIDLSLLSGPVTLPFTVQLGALNRTLAIGCTLSGYREGI